MDNDRGGDEWTVDDMTEDEARFVLERKHITGEVPVVVKYPWWVTLRVPMLILALSFLVNSAAILSLTLLTVNDTNESREARELRACRDEYTAEITEATAQTRAATAEGQVLFNAGLLVILTGGEAGDVDAEMLRAANQKIGLATAADTEAIAARDAWEAAGSPLPCPLNRADDEPPVTSLG